MPTRPQPHQVDATTTAWEQASAVIRRSFLDSLAALAAVRDDLADGYPAQSMADHTGSGDLTPTEAAAAAREHASDLERRALRAYMGIDRAFVSLANVLAEITKAQPSDQLAIAEQANEAGGFCVNCAKYDVQSVRQKAAWCHPCYQYRCSHDLSDRPRALVIAHERRRVSACRSHHRGVRGRERV